MSARSDYPVRLACASCRWTDVSYTAGHHRSHVKLGHKINRDPKAARCSGEVYVVTDDPNYPKGAAHEPSVNWPTSFDPDAYLDAIEARCTRGEHDFDGSFTFPPVCPDCGAEASRG